MQGRHRNPWAPYDDETTRQQIAMRLHQEWAIGKGRPRQNVVLTEKSFDPAELTQRVPLRTLLSAIQRSSEPIGRLPARQVFGIKGPLRAAWGGTLDA